MAGIAYCDGSKASAQRNTVRVILLSCAQLAHSDYIAESIKRPFFKISRCSAFCVYHTNVKSTACGCRSAAICSCSGYFVHLFVKQAF